MKKTISEVLDTDYKEFGHYTISNRAIPSVIDGFKPTARKVIFIANKLWKNGNEKPIKVFQLTGRMAADANFHHGESGSNSAIIGMAQSFKNSLPLLEEVGQFGSLRSPEAGAPRYISTKLSKNFKLLYKDFELCESKIEDGLEIEPRFFLPIVPTVLLNGTSGIAVGFATNILNRNPKQIVDATIAILNDKKYKELMPWRKDFNGNVEKIGPNSYRFSGLWEHVNTSTIKISELPPSMTYQKFESILDALETKGIIKSYDDNSSATPEYIIKLSRETLSKLVENNKIESTFKLAETETENLTCLDENDKLIEFETVDQILKYFVNFRLKYYDLRKEKLVEDLEDRILFLSNRAKFIDLIIKKKLKIDLRKKAEIINELLEMKLDKRNDSFDYLLSMPIHSLSKETYDALMKELNEERDNLMAIKKTEPIDMYKTDLNELKKIL